MADTLPNIELPQGVYVDLYAASEIDVGTAIRTQNLGTADVLLTAQEDEPTGKSNYIRLQFAVMAENEAGDTGAWAISPWNNGLVNVAIAT